MAKTSNTNHSKGSNSSNNAFSEIVSTMQERLTIYRPMILDVLKDYNISTFKSDLVAGIIVGIVALPLSMALAIATGLPPMMGLFAAIFGGGITAIFGGSKFQVTGPTAAFIVILVPIVSKYGVNGLMISGIIAGVMLLIMGITGLGTLIKYIPYPVTTGFTTGIALSIATTQVSSFLGLDIPSKIAFSDEGALLLSVTPEKWAMLDEAHKTNFTRLEYVEKLEVLFHQITTANIHVIVVSVLTLLVLIFWPKYVSKRIPAPLPALIFATLLGFALKAIGWNDIILLGDKYTILPTLTFAIPGQFDPKPFMNAEAIANASESYFRQFYFTFKDLKELIPAGATIAILGAIESLLSAVVADGLTGTKHRSNTELIGQGIGNIAAPFFGGFAVTGAIARTATNIRNGGKTNISPFIHAIVVLVIILIAAPLASYIPLCALASILLIVCWNMSEIHHFIKLFKAPKSDIAVLLTCFFLTVFLDMIWAVAVGVTFAALLFMRRMADLTQVTVIDPHGNNNQLESSNETTDSSSNSSISILPKGALIYSIDGPFFFGAAEKGIQEMDNISVLAKVVIIKLNRVPIIDATGIYALSKIFSELSGKNIKVIFSGVREQPLSAMEKSGLLNTVGRGNFCSSIEDAIERSKDLLADKS